MDWWAEEFEGRRGHLHAVATRVLGSPTEADDALQEAWLRMQRAGTDGVDNLGGWMTTVVSRICLDMLRSRAARRESGEEPADAPVPGPGPEDQAVLADSVGAALLVVLDQLTPAERLSFVLHDLFGLPYDEIAPVVGRSPEAARQLASRGRRRVQGTRPQPTLEEVARQRRVVDAFLAASREGRFADLLALLDPDVVVRADAATLAMGGQAQPEIAGADVVARWFSGRAQAARPVLLDGLPGLAWVLKGEVKVVFAFTLSEAGQVIGIELLSDAGTLQEMDVEVVRGAFAGRAGQPPGERR